MIWLMAMAIGLRVDSGGDKTGILLPAVDHYVQTRIAEFDSISESRKERLRELSRYVAEAARHERPIRLLFVCTHNSRRSQLAQLWAQTAAVYFEVSDVQTYSGGIEATAFNPRAVEAARRAGLEINKTTADDNPVYHVRFAPSRPWQTCFSKLFNQAPNPRKDFCVIMVCSDADRACPAVPGATVRIALPFEDPKSADGTPDESKVYDERCRQIAREILYAFSAVKKSDDRQ